MQVINHAQAENLMRNSGGKIFTVNFIKRSNGAPRTMTGRRGVGKGVKQSTPDERAKREAADKRNNLMRVSEFCSYRDELGRFKSGGTQFRSFGLETVTSLQIGKEKYTVQ